MIKDADIREPLFEFLEERYSKLRIIEEKQIAKARADVMVVLENRIIGIEIKSDADTYVRLKKQVANYNLFFDYNYVVAGSTHGNHIGEHVPDYWGIITVEEMEDGRLDFYVVREATINKRSRAIFKLKRRLSILWRPELAKLLEINGMPKYNHLSKRAVQEKLLEKLDQETLDRQICDMLFERDYSTIAETIEEYRKAKITKKSETKATKKTATKATAKKANRQKEGSDE